MDMQPNKPQLLPDDVVGDTRRLRLISIDPASGKDKSLVGEVWQDPTGNLHGTGIAAVMLYEPVAAAKYRMASVAEDLSPLTVFYTRISRSSFIRAELVSK